MSKLVVYSCIRLFTHGYYEGHSSTRYHQRIAAHLSSALSRLSYRDHMAWKSSVLVEVWLGVRGCAPRQEH